MVTPAPGGFVAATCVYANLTLPQPLGFPAALTMALRHGRPESGAAESSAEDPAAPSPITLVRTSTPNPGIGYEASELRRDVRNHLLFTCAKDAREATAEDLYRAFSHAVRDRLVHRWLATQRTYVEGDVKQAYYLSSEFLTGRSLGLCLMNLGLHDTAERLADEHGMDLGAILEAEGDPGLGNGGLGRLAACFMDSLATLELPAAGYGIRYEFGIFEQGSRTGQQVERTTTGCSTAIRGSCRGRRMRSGCSCAAARRCGADDGRAAARRWVDAQT